MISSAVFAQTEKPPPPEEQVQQAIEAGDYSGAVKLSIAHFRPDLHCGVLVAQAAAQQRAAEKIALSPGRPADEEVTRANQALLQARAYRAQARELAGKYISAGWPAALTEQVERLIETQLGELATLEAAMDRLRRQAMPLEVLLTHAVISKDEIQRLSPELKLIVGLHLIDRGENARAISDCLIPVQLGQAGIIKALASATAELLEEWQAPAGSRRKWDDLINSKGLDTFEALRKEMPQQTQLAGWYLCFVARLARDHYDVSSRTISDTAALLEQLSLPAPQREHEKLLACKRQHELFLLNRRTENWAAAAPSESNLLLYEKFSSWSYAAEAALIAAVQAPGSAEANTLLQRAGRHIETIEGTNTQLADALRARVVRHEASTKPFADWLKVVTASEYRDRRGTIAPDIMIETRARFAARVRAGFEVSIAEALSAGHIDDAFQLAQRAKALAVGRTLAATADPQPAALAEAELISSKLLSSGAGSENIISRKELFIEYFFGPTQAWAFYALAPDDAFESLKVVELDREAVISACRLAVAEFHEGRPPANPERWLLQGKPEVTIPGLWELLGEIKKPNRQMRRAVIAPDGPLCYLPLPSGGDSVFSSVTYLPTAAILKSSEYLNARDVKLMWEGQRSHVENTIGQPPLLRRSGGAHVMTLWNGVTLPLLLQDAAQ